MLRAWPAGVLVALLLTSCAAAPSGPLPTPAAPSTSEATVEVGDITPVISLSAAVASGTYYEITSPVAGVARVRAGVLSVVHADGTSTTIHFRKLDSDRTILIPDGADVVAGLPIASAHYRGFTLTASVTGATRLRLLVPPESAKAQVEGAGAPFDCDLLDRRPTVDPDTGTSVVSCIVPKDQAVLDGLVGIVAVRYPTVQDVLTLPVEAVAGTIDSASVFVDTDGTITEVPVTVGATDGISIEIVSGLDEGDAVRIPSPALIDP
ncbi:MAG: hypothetical protein JWP32_1327 [Schumannella sp.]|nr:hypothetical protein [Schumannella sp.]